MNSFSGLNAVMNSQYNGKIVQINTRITTA